MREIIEKAKKVLLDPAGFYSSLKENKIEPALRYYAILLLVNSVIGTILGFAISSFVTSSTFLGLPVNRPPDDVGQLGLVATIPFAIVGYIIAALLSFVGAGIMHLWIKLFGGKGNYTRTYQLYVYSDTPYLVLGWIPFVSFIAKIYGFIILVIGTTRLHSMKSSRVVVMYLIPTIVGIILLVTGLLAAFSFLKNIPLNQG